MRRLVEGQSRVEVDAATVGEAIEALCRRYMPLRDRLLKPNGRLKPSLVIFVNDAQPAAKPETVLKEGDTLVLIQPVGGG